MWIILRFLETYFRHRWLYLLPMVVLAGVGAVYVLSAAPTYLAGASILVQKETLLTSLTAASESGFAWVTPAEATTQEIQELLLTDAFVRAAIQETDLEARMADPQSARETLTRVRESLGVQPAGDHLLFIGGVDEDPEIAIQVVQAVVTLFLRWKTNADREEATTAVTFFENQLATYAVEVDQARAALQAFDEAHPPPLRGDRPPGEAAELRRLEDELDAAVGLHKSARDKLESARLSLSLADKKAERTYLVVDAPRLVAGGGESRLKQAMTVGVFAGAGLGVVLAGVALLTLLDQSARAAGDVQRTLGLPVLTTTPDTAPRRGRLARLRRRGKKETAE